jgi:N-acetylglucosaminyldiphosphoundecaprenol N-acetyl-beta-D-mannosaminyltransferase
VEDECRDGRGAAFDFIAGNRSPGSKWMSRKGLELVCLLVTEPRRLAMRSFKHNPSFVLKFLGQLLSGKD